MGFNSYGQNHKTTQKLGKTGGKKNSGGKKKREPEQQKKKGGKETKGGEKKKKKKGEQKKKKKGEGKKKTGGAGKKKRQKRAAPVVPHRGKGSVVKEKIKKTTEQMGKRRATRKKAKK